MWGVIMDKTNEEVKFTKFIYEATNSNEISFEKYMELLNQYVQQDNEISYQTKQQFEVNTTYFMLLLDCFDIDKNKTVVYEVE